MDNIPIKATGDTLTANEYNNGTESELKNAVISSGQSLSSGDQYQLSKSQAIYVAVGDFYVDTGSGNFYNLHASSPLNAPIQYLDGMRVRFRISHTNTGPSTINVNALGVKNIVKEDGITALSAGDLPIGQHGELIFHSDKNAFELYSHKAQTEGFRTGEVVFGVDPSAKDGWVSYTADGTIGDASSAASVRANADCQNLYVLWWTYFNDIDCEVIGGRTTALADFNAHKKMHVYPYYNRVIAARSATHALGDHYDDDTHALTEAENGPHGHGVSDTKHTHSYSAPISNTSRDGPDAPGGPVTLNVSASLTYIGILSSGSGTPHNIIQPTTYQVIFVKL